MRKINTNGYAGKVLLTGACCLGLSLGLRALSKWAVLCLPPAVPSALGYAGIAVMAGFFVLLAVELRQDAARNAYYLARGRAKALLEDGRYACEACGCAHVRARDRRCPVCGVTFTTARKDKYAGA